MNSVGNLSSLCSFPLEDRINIKKLGRPVPDLNITQTVTSGKRTFKRVFKRELYNSNEWLCGCDIKNAFFCFPCVLFGGEESWTKTGISDINHLSFRMKKHASSTVHLKNCLKFTLFGAETNIASQLDSAYRQKIAEDNEKVRHNRYILNNVINCVRYCGAFELALRGHDESESSSNPGIFNGLVNFSSELDSVLKTYLEKTTVFKGSSKTIQNELLMIMLEVCQEEISKQIKEADFLAIIADETSDVSNKFQMAVVYRYVFKGRPVERFWTFIIPNEHDAQALSSYLISELKKQKIHETPEKLIAQTYDGASVMSGSFGGVQSIMKETFPNANYIHCYAHQFNLIISKAASMNRDVRVFFSNLQGICSYFSNNPQRTNILDEVVQKRLPRAPATRWNFVSPNVNTVFNYKKDIISCMDEILNSDRIKSDLCQASGFKKILTSHDFSFWLSFFSKVMPFVEILLGQLQKGDIDASKTQQAICKFELDIRKLRDKIDNDNSSRQQPTSNSSKKRKLDNIKWNIEAKEICDAIINSVRDRFSFTEHLVASSLFLAEMFPMFATNFPEERLESICSVYQFFDKKKLHNELSSIYDAEEFRSISGVVSLLDFLVTNNLEGAFSECTKLLKLICTIPMTSVEAERCFSTLKRIKTFARNTTSQEMLTALAMLSIENDLFMDIPDFNQKVIEKFSAQKERRMDFHFK